MAGGNTGNTLKMAEIRSNLHTGQYAGSVSFEHGQRQALVEPLSLPGVARHVNVFFCKTVQARGNGLAIHTFGGGTFYKVGGHK